MTPSGGLAGAEPDGERAREWPTIVLLLTLGAGVRALRFLTDARSVGHTGGGGVGCSRRPAKTPATPRAPRVASVIPSPTKTLGW